MKKILTVPSLLAYVEQEDSILKRADFRILTAHSGEELLKIHRAEKADMIIMDIEADGMAGDKLCSAIKKDKGLNNAYVVLVCQDTGADIKKCTKAKADFYITKPIDSALLLKKIREVLDIRMRGSDRIPLKITVVGSSGKTFSCYAHDLSASGILIETDKVLHKGDSVGCLFCLGDSREIVVNGEIARVKIMSNDVYQYGIKFFSLPAKSLAAIKVLTGR